MAVYVCACLFICIYFPIPGHCLKYISTALVVLALFNAELILLSLIIAMISIFVLLSFILPLAKI